MKTTSAVIALIFLPFWSLGFNFYRDPTYTRISLIRAANSKRGKKVNRKQDIIRSNDGIPVTPIKANRPSVYKSITSGGSGRIKVRNQGSPREQQIMNPNRLRIIAGTAKGKKIISPDVYLRPMMAKVREAVFSTLDYVGLFSGNTTRVLDMFSGSGSVGLEALSRGAAHCTFIDLSPNCIETSITNANNCGFEGQVSAVCTRAEDILRHPSKFNIHEKYHLVSITPPYQEVSYKDLIDAVCESPVLDSGTIVIIEYPEEMGSLPPILGEDKLFGIRNRRYGRTVLGMYVYRPSDSINMRPDEFQDSALR